MTYQLHLQPYIDEIFLNSPLCLICEFGNYGVGGVCYFLLNRRVPDLVIRNAKVITCSAHKSCIKNLDQSSEIEDFHQFLNRPIDNRLKTREESKHEYG
ncbi:hypothetical protein [Candidatus Hodarchaeum mangrovi]